MTDIADLIRDSYEVLGGPIPAPTPSSLGRWTSREVFPAPPLFPVWMQKGIV